VVEGASGGGGTCGGVGVCPELFWCVEGGRFNLRFCIAKATGWK